MPPKRRLAPRKRKLPAPSKKPASRVRRKKQTAAAVAETAATPAIADFYRERRRMRTQIAKDRAQRYARFLRAVQNPSETPKAGVAKRAVRASSTRQPLRVLAEGDSWFEYPLPIPQGNGVIVQLEKLLGYPIANMAHHGLEVGQIMGLSIRQELIARLSDPNVRFDALLFSGGGDDLVGDRFCIFLKDTPPVLPPDQMINTAALEPALAVLEEEFRELIDIRDQCSPETVMFVNCYDFPPVTGKGVCGAGPWLKPSLDYAYKHLGVINPSPDDEFVVVKTVLQQFKAMLDRIAGDAIVKNFVVVPTQGALNPGNTDWQNEIHPSTRGFQVIAGLFLDALNAQFPT